MKKVIAIGYSKGILDEYMKVNANMVSIFPYLNSSRRSIPKYTFS